MPARLPAASLRTRSLGALLLALVAGCSGGSEREPAATEPTPPDVERAGPATARWEVVERLRESAELSHAPADGGGRARLLREPEQEPFAVVGRPDRFRLVYEVGPHGIAQGGAVYLQVSPFWGWSTPQVVDPEAPGYTRIEPQPAAGVEGEIGLRPETVDHQLLAIEVTGRPLVAGDRLEIVYGAGGAGARPDRYAERRSRFWIAVDGDADGTRRVLSDSPAIDVRPGPAAALLVTVPTVARPGEPFRVALAFVDAGRNAGVRPEEEVRFVDPPEALDLPERVSFAAENGGVRSVRAVAREPGIYRLRIRAGELEAESNPLVVSAEGPRVLWGDLHGHSNLSDGTGVPADYFAYARDVSALDVVALTDHDHWGILPLVRHAALWEEIREQTRRFHEPGHFVTLLGFEWTSWIHGHRHVLYFEDDGPLVDSVDPATDHPEELWEALEGRAALTITHHPAGGPIATNWEVAPDPRFETVTEIVSVHGSSEAPDAPGIVYDAVPGHFARDALERGYRLGFVGSGDRHDGHPGAYRVSPPEGGLTAILAEEPTREAVLAALRARRVYATNGPRILLRTALGAAGMGQTFPLAPGETGGASLYVRIVAEAPLERIDLIRSGAVTDTLDLEGRLEATLQKDVANLRAGEYLYVRAIQRNGGAAWSSPIFVEAEGPDEDP